MNKPCNEAEQLPSEATSIEQHLRDTVAVMRRSCETEPALRGKERLYVCVEDFLLQNGRAFNGVEPLPQGMRRGKDHECYKNAFLLMGMHPSLTYVEGVAVSTERSVPTHHAWCVDEQGRVIDPTWPNGRSYFGVPFTREYVLATYTAIGRLGVIRNMEQGFPLLATKIKGFREEKFFQ